LKHSGDLRRRAPTVNRQAPGQAGQQSGFTWAPILPHATGTNNRNQCVRLPLARGRVELRCADSAHIRSWESHVLAAGIEGIEQAMDPGDPNRETVLSCRSEI